MTEQEAIENFKEENKILSQYAKSKFQKEVFAKKIERDNMAIKALEKQIPQTFFENKFNKMHIGDTVNGICPVCFTDFVCITPKYYKEEGYGYCKQCGQKLDWGEEE